MAPNRRSSSLAPRDAFPSEPRNETAEEILVVAIRHLEQFGIAGVKIESVLREAKASTGSLYHFFGSKEELLIAAEDERYLQLLLREQQSVLNDVQDFADIEQFAVWIAVQLIRMARDERVVEIRKARIKITGNALHHPQLMSSLITRQNTLFSAVGSMIDVAKTKGFVADFVDGFGFAAWFHGMTLGLGAIEMTLDDRERWLKQAIPATLCVLGVPLRLPREVLEDVGLGEDPRFLRQDR
jgi:AcrR family transcriptional regulator